MTYYCHPSLNFMLIFFLHCLLLQCWISFENRPKGRNILLEQFQHKLNFFHFVKFFKKFIKLGIYKISTRKFELKTLKTKFRDNLNIVASPINLKRLCLLFSINITCQN